MTTGSEKLINAALAELEGTIDGAVGLAQKMDAANLRFPAEGQMAVARALCNVIRKQQIMIHDLNARVSALESKQ